jgi:hypothetical protein
VGLKEAGLAWLVFFYVVLEVTVEGIL